MFDWLSFALQLSRTNPKSSSHLRTREAPDTSFALNRAHQWCVSSIILRIWTRVPHLKGFCATTTSPVFVQANQNYRVWFIHPRSDISSAGMLHLSPFESIESSFGAIVLSFLVPVAINFWNSSSCFDHLTFWTRLCLARSHIPLECTHLCRSSIECADYSAQHLPNSYWSTYRAHSPQVDANSDHVRVMW